MPNRHQSSTGDEEMKKNLERQLLYIKDVEQITGLHRSTLRRKWGNGQLPKPLLLDSRLVWHSNTINQWIEEAFVKGAISYEQQ